MICQRRCKYDVCQAWMTQKKNKNTTDSLFGEPTTIYIPIQRLETLGGT